MALAGNRRSTGFVDVIFTLSLLLLAGCGGGTGPAGDNPIAEPEPAKTEPRADNGGRIALHVPGMTKRLKLE